MSDEICGNENANGNGGRFNGLAELFKAGGTPNRVSDEFKAAYLGVRDYVQTREPLPADMTIVELGREMARVRAAKEAADQMAKELGARFDFLRLVALPGAMDEQGVRTMKVDGLGRLGIRGDIYASIRPGMKERAYEWLDENGRGDLVQPSVNASTLKASLKKMLEEGEEIPEDLFRVEPYSMVTITKA